jgi:hypothetical protein
MSIDLAKVGAILREQREGKGIGLEKVSNALCLRKSLIVAMESGKWDLLPHEVYVRSYLKEYATFLNIYDNIASELLAKPEEPEPTAEIPVVDRKIPRPRRMAGARIPRKVLIYPAILILLVGFYLIEKMNRDYVPIPRIETTSPVPAVAPANSESKTMPAIPDGKKLLITCNERAWVSVVIDGSEKKEFMLNAQEMIMLQAKDRFDLLIGNAGGVKLILDGKDVEFTGKSGEVKRVKLS